MRKRKSLICGYCHKIYYPASGHLNQKFCSRKCSDKGKDYSGKKGRQYPHTWKAKIKKCPICEKEFRAVKDYWNRKQIYCSHKCFEVDWKKNVRPKMKYGSCEGVENNAWKGDGAGYSAIHKWITNQKGKPKKCEHCGKSGAGRYEWANKDHKYKRELSDYIGLCPRCHRRYDSKFNKITWPNIDQKNGENKSPRKQPSLT